MKLSIRRKIIGLTLIASVLPVIVIALIIGWQKSNASRQLLQTMDQLGRENLAQISRDAYGICEAANDLIQRDLDGALNVAADGVKRAGGIRLTAQTVSWDAVNQLSKTSSKVTLPRMNVGSSWLGQNQDAGTPTQLVDQVKNLVGGTCTVFQRMNDQGDMLRVATNVLTDKGARAIGTYIPAVEPDGKANAVVAAVLKGETYRGRAFVVNAWYLTAYQPIKDTQSRVIGMLYVGIKQEAVPSLRQAISKVKVGKTGYVYVLGGKGAQRGQYIISLRGERDGENIWEAKDASGRQFIQSIVGKGTALKPGEVAYEEYPWQNKNEKSPRTKVAALTYFEPWDWVIGASMYEEDYHDAEANATAALTTVMRWSIGGGLAAMVLVGLFSILTSGGIARSIGKVMRQLGSGADQVASAAGQISSASQSLAQGAQEQAAAIEQTSSSLEMLSSMTGQNADNAKSATALMTDAGSAVGRVAAGADSMHQAMKDIKSASDQTSKIVKTIDMIAFQTNLLALNAAVEAARAGESGKGFAVVAEEVRALARKAAEAAKSTESLIEENVNHVAGGVRIVEGLKSVLTEVTSHTSRATTLVSEVAEASLEQSRAVEQITSAVSEMNRVTQQTAGNAEESASASEEMNAQAESLRDSVTELSWVVDGSSDRTV